MSDTPETDASCGYALSSHYGRLEGSYLQMDWSGPFVHAEVARKLERERDDAREKAERYRIEANAMMMQRDEWAAMCGRYKQERDEAIRQRNETNESSVFSCNFYYEEKLKAERERNEIQEKYDKLATEHMLAVNKLCEERDEAREQAQRLRVQLNHYSQANEMAEQAFRERDEAHKIAEQAIDDLAWFNETNAQRLRNELDQLNSNRSEVL